MNKDERTFYQKKSCKPRYMQICVWFYTVILNLISPPICFYCKDFLAERLILCDRCKFLVNPITSATLIITKTQTIKVFAISDYHDPIRSFIVGKFWHDRVGSAYLGKLIWHMTPIQHMPIDYIVPIPLHWRRQAHRGFNQAEIIAQELAKKSGAPYVRLLKKAKHTMPQSTLTKMERSHNLESVFVLTAHDAAQFQGKHLVLVDDLMTTGATLQQAARELLKLKPASLVAVVGCRVV